jgi:uncharacterized protein (DUF952 family)
VASELFHIVGSGDWAEAQAVGRYAPDQFALEGFIHLSQREQILRPANLLYGGRTDLLLLRIDPDLLRADVVYEPGSHGESELFPHLYGQLNLDAVVGVVPFACEADGSFVLPSELS